jgi:dTDP-4-dehydrorhamnose reductase
LKNGESYEGDTGTYRTPIYVEHLTEGIMQLVANYHPGISHLAGADWMNMYQFGHAVAGAFDLDSRLVNPVPVSADLPPGNATSDGSEHGLRPDILGLDCTQTNQRLGLRAFSVVTGLQEMLV